MAKNSYVQYVSHTPTTTSATSVATTTFGGLLEYDWFTVDASVAGNTSGSLDVYLQRQVIDSARTTSVWVDWMRLPQIAAATARKTYTATAQAVQGFTTCGTGTGAGYPIIAANTVVGGHPGDRVRLVTKSGTGTTASSAVRVWLTAWQGRD
jgi:hypothetical protein